MSTIDSIGSTDATDVTDATGTISSADVTASAASVDVTEATRHLLIGEGAYGKVYRPALIGVRPERHISKVMIDEYAQNELKQYTKLGISTIDPTCRYHMGPPTMMALDPPWTRLWHKDASTEQYYCERYGLRSASLPYDVGESYTVLNYRDGGETLSHRIKILRESRSVSALQREMVDLKNIVDGLSLLHQHKIYHMDVKVPNIVTDKRHYRLIDFGIAVRDKRDLELLAPSIYYFWPPEILLLRTGSPLLTVKGYNEFIDKVEADYPSHLKQAHANQALVEQLNKCSLDMIISKVDTWSFGQTIRWMHDHLHLAYSKVYRGRTVLADMARLVAYCSAQDPVRRPTMAEVSTYYECLFSKC
jgi:serine/threonine protein kinase